MILIGLFVAFVFGRSAIRHQNWQDFVGLAAGCACVLWGARSLRASRRAEE